MKKFLATILVILLPVSAFTATDAELIRDAKAKYTAGQSEEAVKILDSMISLNPSNQQAKKVLADICVDTGEREYEARNFKNAFEYFKKAVKAMPTHPIASERYWAMKKDFDVNNLKNEGAAIQAQPAVAVASPAVVPSAPSVKQETPVVAEKKEKTEAPVKSGTKKEPKSPEEEYLNKILQMEARFNKRMLEMSSQNQKLIQQREAEVQEGEFMVFFRNNTALSAAIIAGIVLSIIALGFLINVLIKKIKEIQRKRKGRLEYTELFETESAGINYNDLIKMQNIKDVLNKIKTGETDWAAVKKSISDMDRELRIEMLNIVENKLNRERQPLTIGQADLLTCLMLDGDEYLRKRVNLFLSGQVERGTGGQFALPYHPGEVTGIPGQLQLPYKNGNGKSKGTLMEISMAETLNLVIPLQKIIDRKVFKDNHSLRVGVDCFYMAGHLGLNQTDANLYYIAGLLHDIGFLDIPSEVFNKRGALDKDEFEKIKTHAQRGIELLDFMALPGIVHDGILYHHEKWSGGGYPENLKGKEIPLAAQAVSLFDVYEALVLPRPQRPPFPASEALKVIKKGAKKLFNPALMEPFQKMYNENMLSREEIWKE